MNCQIFGYGKMGTQNFFKGRKYFQADFDPIVVIPREGWMPSLMMKLGYEVRASRLLFWDSAAFIRPKKNLWKSNNLSNRSEMNS